MNEGFDPVEIAELKKECEQEGQNYVIVEDEDGMNDSGEFAHFQFVGKHEGNEVIYDAVMGTLRLNHSSLVFEEAEIRMKKSFPNYVELERRKPNYKEDEEMELMLEEIIEELEEEEDFKVAEFVEVEKDFEYGIGLDIALGCGGFPKGRIVEIYGPESSGKTTLAIHAIAECQKQGGIAAIVDAEHAFDRFYAEALGVDVNNLLISQPDNGEQALEIVENLIRSGAVDIVVIDSVAALTPRAEIEGEMGESKMGLQARLMSQALRKLTASIGRTNCCCVFINQLREKIWIMDNG